MMRRWAVAVVGLLQAGGLQAQHEHHGEAAAGTGVQWHWGARGVLLGTHVRNGVGGEPVTEGYLTQPTVFAGVSGWANRISAMATISLEGLTLERGELSPGGYGEGYVDRRHPHTYLHEAVLTARTHGSGDGASLTLGRGFAPFGTDDPMMRPFVRFPVNHHLGQVLERLLLVGAVRRGPLVVDAGVFSGDEPSDPRDLGTLSRFGDSWSARVTLLPATGVELQASHARVESPELPLGGGWDQQKWSVSARHDAATSFGRLYALAEWERTTEVDDGRAVFSFGSMLAEAALARGDWTGALRLERTDRPEEDRVSAYRTPWPESELHVLGITRWTTATVAVQRSAMVGGVRVAPFVETALAHVGERERGLFERERMYGGTRVWSLSAGARIGLGMVHGRMGRYGAALP